MVRFFESERAYIARMQKRRNMIKNNAELVRLIRAYRNSMNTRRPSYQALMNRYQIQKELVKRAKYILKNLENVPSNRVLMKVLMMYPKSLNARTPRYILVNQPNSTKALAKRM